MILLIFTKRQIYHGRLYISLRTKTPKIKNGTVINYHNFQLACKITSFIVLKRINKHKICFIKYIQTSNDVLLALI